MVEVRKGYHLWVCACRFNLSAHLDRFVWSISRKFFTSNINELISNGYDDGDRVWQPPSNRNIFSSNYLPFLIETQLHCLRCFLLNQRRHGYNTCCDFFYTKLLNDQSSLRSEDIWNVPLCFRLKIRKKTNCKHRPWKRFNSINQKYLFLFSHAHRTYNHHNTCASFGKKWVRNKTNESIRNTIYTKKDWFCIFFVLVCLVSEYIQQGAPQVLRHRFTRWKTNVSCQFRFAFHRSIHFRNWSIHFMFVQLVAVTMKTTIWIVQNKERTHKSH